MFHHSLTTLISGVVHHQSQDLIRMGEADRINEFTNTFRIDILGASYRDHLLAVAVKRSQDVVSLATASGFDEDSPEAPDHA